MTPAGSLTGVRLNEKIKTASIGASYNLRVVKLIGEQDHRGVKSRIKRMLGFNIFDRAAVAIAGIELLHRIRKGQFNLGRLRLNGQAAPAIWSAVLSA